MLNLKFAAGTDRGLIRELNEDSYRIVEGSAGTPYAFIIADGMGGHNCGEIASNTAADFVCDYVKNHEPGLAPAENCKTLLNGLLKDANTAVYNKSLEIPAATGMGTTLTMAVFLEGTVTVAHVGDSRLYLVRNGQLRQITTDHSYIEELVRNGSLTRAEAERHPRKNLITRAIGCTPELEVDTMSLETEKNDIFILCTDGLTNMLSEDEILRSVLEDEPEAACRKMIDSANNHGGEDNITVIVINCE